jgi:hypothetical protein
LPPPETLRRPVEVAPVISTEAQRDTQPELPEPMPLITAEDEEWRTVGHSAPVLTLVANGSHTAEEGLVTVGSDDERREPTLTSAVSDLLVHLDETLDLIRTMKAVA